MCVFMYHNNISCLESLAGIILLYFVNVHRYGLGLWCKRQNPSVGRLSQKPKTSAAPSEPPAARPHVFMNTMRKTLMSVTVDVTIESYFICTAHTLSLSLHTFIYIYTW